MTHSIYQQASSVVVAVAQFVQRGGKYVTREVRTERIEICKPCDQLTGNKCSQCGCFVSLKTWLPAEQCPLDKWLAIPIAPKEPPP